LLGQGWSLLTAVHNSDMFIPSMGISPYYSGQVLMPIRLFKMAIKLVYM